MSKDPSLNVSPSHTDNDVIRWDHAGGVLIYEEAGGKVTDLDGLSIDFTTGRKMSASKYVESTIEIVF